MRFSEVVNQARALLHSKGRITYRALKREFDLALYEPLRSFPLTNQEKRTRSESAEMSIKRRSYGTDPVHHAVQRKSRPS